MTDSNDEAHFEIHVHGQIFLRSDVLLSEIELALKPLWLYAGRQSLAAAADSLYQEEPGIEFIADQHVLQICWTIVGEECFRYAMDDVCMNLNELAKQGCSIELSFYDRKLDDFDEDDVDDEETLREAIEGAQDNYALLFVGPTPSAIMQAQRDLLVQDLIALMERHFDANELTHVVSEVDRLFDNRFESLVKSLQLGSVPRSESNSGKHSLGRSSRPRRLH